MKEWEHHVIQTPRGDRGRGGTAYCGAEVWSHEWHFLDAAHAARTVARGDRLQPCPACWGRIPDAEKAHAVYVDGSDDECDGADR